MASISVLRPAPPIDNFRWQTITICERILSAGALAALTPVLALSAATVSIISGRTPWIAHKRVGWQGEPLWVLKLRTMWGEDTSVGERRGLVEYIVDDRGPEEKNSADPRVPHWFARFCRRHSVDEIPQLWHVVRGEMSLVGPRPLTAAELHRHYGPDAEETLLIKPGIVGLWQVSGRNRLTYLERKKLDLFLVRSRSPRLYLTILFRAVGEVFKGTNSW